MTSAAPPERRTLRRVLLLALVVALAGVGVAASCSKGRSGTLHVEPNPIDFGVHRWDEERVQLPVRVVNGGDHPVTLRDPSFDCGCFYLLTLPAKSKLQPGEALDLVIVMDITKKPAGRFAKTLMFKTDDPAHPALDTPIVGNVVDYRKIEPKNVHFGDVPAAGPAAERKVEVRGGDGSVVRVLKAVASDAKRLSVEVRPTSYGGDVLVRTVPGAPPGGFSLEVQVTLEVRPAEGGDAHVYEETIWVQGVAK